MSTILRFYHTFARELCISGCFISTGLTLGYIVIDCHNLEIKHIKKEYDSRILSYEREIHKLKGIVYEKGEMK